MSDLITQDPLWLPTVILIKMGFWQTLKMRRGILNFFFSFKETEYLWKNFRLFSRETFFSLLVCFMAPDSF